MRQPEREVEIFYKWVRVPPVTDTSEPIKVALPSGARIVGTHPTMDGNGMWIYYTKGAR